MSRVLDQSTLEWAVSQTLRPGGDVTRLLTVVVIDGAPVLYYEIERNIASEWHTEIELRIFDTGEELPPLDWHYLATTCGKSIVWRGVTDVWHWYGRRTYPRG